MSKLFTLYICPNSIFRNKSNNGSDIFETMTNILEEVDREVDGENDEKSGEKVDSNDSTRKSSGSDQNDNIKKPKHVKDQWGNVIKSKKI